jgi:hypothetical protein
MKGPRPATTPAAHRRRRGASGNQSLEKAGTTRLGRHVVAQYHHRMSCPMTTKPGPPQSPVRRSPCATGATRPSFRHTFQEQPSLDNKPRHRRRGYPSSTPADTRARRSSRSRRVARTAQPDAAREPSRPGTPGLGPVIFQPLQPARRLLHLGQRQRRHDHAATRHIPDAHRPRRGCVRPRSRERDAHPPRGRGRFQAGPCAGCSRSHQW